MKKMISLGAVIVWVSVFHLPDSEKQKIAATVKPLQADWIADAAKKGDCLFCVLVVHQCVVPGIQYQCGR